MTQNNSRRPRKTQKSKVLWTDRQTDRPTDRPTDGADCRVACTRLKTFIIKQYKQSFFLQNFSFIYSLDLTKPTRDLNLEPLNKLTTMNLVVN